MATRIPGGEFPEASADDALDRGSGVTRAENDHSLLAEDPLTGLPWTETLLPLVMRWAGSSAVHAICLHFAGLGVLANLPEFQSSHSLLREAADRLGPLMGEDDRPTRFSGNKLLVFSKRPDAGIRRLLVEAADSLATLGAEVDGRRLPEFRVGMAVLGGGDPVTVEAINGLMSEAAGITIPMAEVVMPWGVTEESDPPPAPGVQPPPPAAVEAPPPVPLGESTRAADLPGDAEDTRLDLEDATPQTATTGEEIQPTMISRGHLDRTPIRQAAEPVHQAAAPRTGPEPDHRLALRGVEVVVTGLVATAMVELDLDGRTVRGKAIGRSAEGHHVALVGEAIARAVTDLLPAGHGVVFREAVPTATQVGDVLVTVTEFLTPDRAEFLFGVAPTEGEMLVGMTRSVLNAVNELARPLLAS